MSVRGLGCWWLVFCGQYLIISWPIITLTSAYFNKWWNHLVSSAMTAWISYLWLKPHLNLDLYKQKNRMKNNSIIRISAFCEINNESVCLVSLFLTSSIKQILLRATTPFSVCRVCLCTRTRVARSPVVLRSWSNCLALTLHSVPILWLLTYRYV